jgi:hypothetical protein
MTTQEVKRRTTKSELYREEFGFIFNKRAFCVRGVLVISALVEAQIFLLAESFLEEKGVKYRPDRRQEYSQWLNILQANDILNSKELKQIEKFREERNTAIHRIFKGMTRRQWEEQNNRVVELGRLIVKNLDEKLYPGE